MKGEIPEFCKCMEISVVNLRCGLWNKTPLPQGEGGRESDYSSSSFLASSMIFA